MSHGVVPHGIAEGTRLGMAPLARRLRAFGVTPNVVTVVGLVITLAGSALLALDRPIPAAAVLLVGALADTLDGALARASGAGTPFGAFLDSTVDRLGDAAVLAAAVALGAARGDEILVWGALAALVAGFLVSYVRAKAESLGAPATVGLAPREARLAILLIGLGLAGALALPQLFVAAVAIVASLATLTLIQRIAHVANALGK